MQIYLCNIDIHDKRHGKIQTGNRLIMMYNGHIMFEVSGEEKKNLTVDQLMKMFSQAAGEEFADDQSLLNK